MDIEHNHIVEDSTSSVTWAENFILGIKALLLHPFFPLADTGFKYECLFATKSTRHHRAESRQAICQNIPQRSSLNELRIDREAGSRFLNHTGQIVSNIYHVVVDYLRTKDNNSSIVINEEPRTSSASQKNLRTYLIPAQLLILTVIWIYILIKDLRKVMKSTRTITNTKSAHRDLNTSLQ